MDNMMNFSYITRFCHSILKTAQVRNNRADVVDGATFYDKLAGKEEAAAESAAWRQSITMAEYKLYLYDKIAALPVHSSNMADSISVHISDEGFAAMKNDPAYEQWVLDCLKTNFQCPDPWSGTSGGKFMVFHFGATKEESRIESWRLGFRNGNGRRAYNEKSKDSFWERRRKKRQELLAQLEELEEKKALSKRMARSEYFMDLARISSDAGESSEPLNCDRLAMQIFSSFKANILLQSFQGKKV